MKELEIPIATIRTSCRKRRVFLRPFVSGLFVGDGDLAIDLVKDVSVPRINQFLNREGPPIRRQPTHRCLGDAASTVTLFHGSLSVR